VEGNKYQTWAIYTDVISSLLSINISTASSVAKAPVAKLDSPNLIRFLAVEPMQPHNRGIVKGCKVLSRQGLRSGFVFQPEGESITASLIPIERDVMDSPSPSASVSKDISDLWCALKSSGSQTAADMPLVRIHSL
jgi:hypothetical protein